MAYWKIYIREREMAHEVGDPLLGVVRAGSKEAAEFAAAHSRWVRVSPAGYWAVRCDRSEADQYVCDPVLESRPPGSR